MQVRVGMWAHPAGSPIEALSPAVAPAAALGLRQAPAAPLLYVAAGQEEVGLWDIAQGRCHQVCLGARFRSCSVDRDVSCLEAFHFERGCR